MLIGWNKILKNSCFILEFVIEKVFIFWGLEKIFKNEIGGE